VLLSRVRRLEVSLAPPDHYGRRELGSDFETKWLPLTVRLLMTPGVADGCDEAAAANLPVVSWLLARWDEHVRAVTSGHATPESRRAALRLPAALVSIVDRLRPADRSPALCDGWPLALAVGAAHLHLRIAPDITADALAAVVEAVSRPRPDDVPSIAWGCVCCVCGSPRCDMSAPCPYCPAPSPPAVWGCRADEFPGLGWFRLAGEELDAVEGWPAAELTEEEPT
jgi:hypothetical protein